MQESDFAMVELISVTSDKVDVCGEEDMDEIGEEADERFGNTNIFNKRRRVETAVPPEDRLTLPKVLPPRCFSWRRVALLALSEADHGSLTACASVDSTQSLAARMLLGATSGVACVE